MEARGLTSTWNTSYCSAKNFPNHDYFSFTNDSSQTIFISHINLKLGVGKSGNTFTAGTHITADGKPLNIKAAVTSSGDWPSDTQTISNQISVTSGGYPNYTEMGWAAFIFDGGIPLAAGATTLFYLILSPTDQGWTDNSVFVWDRTTGVVSYSYQPITFTLSYDANGGSGAPASVSGSTVTISSAPSTPATYTLSYDANGGSVSPASASRDRSFLGWNTDPSGNGTTYQPGDSITLSQDTTLYAKWGSATIGPLPTPTRQDCQFAIWTTTLNGTTSVSASDVINSDRTIYAKWRYGISLNSNGGTIIQGGTISGTSFTVYKEHGAVFNFDDYVAYSSTSSEDIGDESDKSWLGWSTDPSATSVEYTSSSQYSTDAPLAVYAIYKTNTFTVRFYKDSTLTNLLQSNTNVAYGSSITPPSDPAEPGKIFRGWSSSSYTCVTQNLNIFGIWTDTYIWVYTASGWIPYEPRED